MFRVQSPLEHFEFNFFSFYYIYIYDFSFTSGSLYLLSLVLFLVLFFFYLKKTPVLGKKAFILIYELYKFVLSVFKQQVKSTRAQRFFPFIFTLFIYIFLMNFTSLFVYGTSLTGHIIVTLFLSLSIFLSLIIYALLSHGRNFFSLFIPNGVPKILLDFIILIEVFSFAIRPFSLAIRLFANMLAGHTLMGIFSQFCAFIIKNYIFLFALPLILVFLVFLLEIAVSAIQAYIFVSLVCIYINDVLELH